MQPPAFIVIRSSRTLNCYVLIGTAENPEAAQALMNEGECYAYAILEGTGNITAPNGVQYFHQDNFDRMVHERAKELAKDIAVSKLASFADTVRDRDARAAMASFLSHNSLRTIVQSGVDTELVIRSFGVADSMELFRTSRAGSVK